MTFPMSVNMEHIKKEIRTLSVAEKRELFDLLWLDIAVDDEPETISSTLEAKLNRSLEEIRRNPQSGIPWSEVKRQILGEK